MKKLLFLAMALVFVITMALGCASLGTIKAEDPQSIQTLLKRVDKCEPDGNGWKILSIPQNKEQIAKNKTEGLHTIVFVVYRKGETYGYGMVSDSNASIVMQWNPETKTWLFISFGVGQPVSDEQQAEFWAEWVKVLLVEFDLNATYSGIPKFPVPEKNV